MMHREFQGVFVAGRAETTNHADREIGEVGVMPERFSLVYVGQVHFDERQLDGSERIAKHHTGVCEAGRVDDDELRAVIEGGMDALDKGRFAVALEGVAGKTSLRRLVDKTTIDCRERVRTVVLRFAPPQRVKVGAVQYQNFWLLASQVLQCLRHVLEFAAK